MSLELQYHKRDIHKIEIWNQNCMAQGTSLKLWCSNLLVSTLFLLCLSAFHISTVLYWLQDIGRLFFYLSVVWHFTRNFCEDKKSLYGLHTYKVYLKKLIVNSVMKTQHINSISLAPNHSVWTLTVRKNWLRQVKNPNCHQLVKEKIRCKSMYI